MMGSVFSLYSRQQNHSVSSFDRMLVCPDNTITGVILMATVYDDPEYNEMSLAFRKSSEEISTFINFLQFSLISPDFDHPRLTIDMRDDLVGNPTYRTLHGGVVASILDIIGGHAVFLSIFKQMRGQPLEKKLKRFSKVGSIDLRIDYLRPGTGKSFTATASIRRTGNKVAVVRMQLVNDKDSLIAVGTGSYTVG